MNGLALPDLGPVMRRFASVDAPGEVLATGDYEIITGFGPTNAPTAGTLSVMLGIIELSRVLAAPLTVVISDLGAWNCRNVAWRDLCYYRDRMAAFLVALGFDNSRGAIRTHLDHQNLIRAGRIARYLTLDDFRANQEEFLALYDSAGLLASRVGLLVDSLYTVADVLQPIENGRAGTLMVSGIEESYFTKLAQLVLTKQALDTPGMNWRGKIGALYFRIVRGLGGYPKMSKSIERSSIHVGLSESEIEKRIMSRSVQDQPAILDAIDLASDWPATQRDAAVSMFHRLPDSHLEWDAAKLKYLSTFSRFARLWGETAGA